MTDQYRNYNCELPFQRPSAPERETDARELYDANAGTLVPGLPVPVLRQPPTPGGPDGDATGEP